MENNISISMIERMAVRFVKERDEFIMTNIVQHLSNNKEEYYLTTISEKHLHHVVRLGLQAFIAEQKLGADFGKEVDYETS